MLTNKNIGVLIIVLSLLFVSCGVDNTGKDTNKDIVKTIKGEKSKAKGGEVSDLGNTVIVSDGDDKEAISKPKFIK